MIIPTSQAKEIMNEFNNSPLQKHVLVTITNKSSGAKASTEFVFSLIRPNPIELAVETLNPFSVVNGLGDAWTAITSGNAYVDFDTTSSLLLDTGIVSPIRFSGKSLTYRESLSVSTPVDWWVSRLPHQIDNALFAYVTVRYLSGTGALVRVDLTPNFEVLGDYNVTIDNQEVSSIKDKYSFTLRLGTLDQKVIEEVNTTSVSPNQSAGDLTNNSGSSTNNSGSSTTCESLIQGHVRAEGGSPISGVKVMVNDGSGNDGVITDSSGFYQAPAYICGGNNAQLDVTYLKNGYQTVTKFYMTGFMSKVITNDVVMKPDVVKSKQTQSKSGSGSNSSPNTSRHEENPVDQQSTANTTNYTGNFTNQRSTSNVPRYAQNPADQKPKSDKTKYWIIGGVVAVGLIAYLIAKKGK